MSTAPSNIVIKCRKCRTILSKSPESALLNAHNVQYSADSDVKSNCSSVYSRTEIYLNEDNLEAWIQDEVEKSEWTKAKLKCVKCQSNIGSFDFVSVQKCDCQRFNQPSVHFIRSKVDVDVLLLDGGTKTSE